MYQKERIEFVVFAEFLLLTRQINKTENNNFVWNANFTNYAYFAGQLLI